MAQRKLKYAVADVEAAVAKIDVSRLPGPLDITVSKFAANRAILTLRPRGETPPLYMGMVALDEGPIEIEIQDAIHDILVKLGIDIANAALRMMRGDQRREPWTMTTEERVAMVRRHKKPIAKEGGA